MSTALVWLRRDLRLTDNPALAAALAQHGQVLCVYVHAPDEEGSWAPGAASRWWLHHSLAALNAALGQRGSALVLRTGPTLAALGELAREAQATAVYWNRLYEPALIARDTAIKQALKAQGLKVESCNANQLCEPWDIATGSGGPYRVFTPFWRKLSAQLEPLAPLPAPSRIKGPALKSLALDELRLRPSIGWDTGFAPRWQPGEAGAHALLDGFIAGAVPDYKTARDRPDQAGTSRLSPHLHFGEIGPRQIVYALASAGLGEIGAPFVRELGWREFSTHLLYHFPHSAKASLNADFERFPWAEPERETLRAWQRGQTGVPIVDAGMRELWQTGWMHNRVRMIVASYLTKNLRYHWIHGARWFWDTLVDADLANNTQGWQWSAGSGADAAPYFRIFNPVLQGQRFDPDGAYVKRFVPELAALPLKSLHQPWTVAPHLLRAAGLADSAYAKPIVDLAQSRDAALAAYRSLRESSASVAPTRSQRSAVEIPG